MIHVPQDQHFGKHVQYTLKLFMHTP